MDEFVVGRNLFEARQSPVFNSFDDAADHAFKVYGLWENEAIFRKVGRRLSMEIPTNADGSIEFI